MIDMRPTELKHLPKYISINVSPEGPDTELFIEMKCPDADFWDGIPGFEARGPLRAKEDVVKLLIERVHDCVRRLKTHEQSAISYVEALRKSMRDYVKSNGFLPSWMLSQLEAAIHAVLRYNAQWNTLLTILDADREYFEMFGYYKEFSDERKER